MLTIVLCLVDTKIRRACALHAPMLLTWPGSTSPDIAFLLQLTQLIHCLTCELPRAAMPMFSLLTLHCLLQAHILEKVWLPCCNLISAVYLHTDMTDCSAGLHTVRLPGALCSAAAPCILTCIAQCKHTYMARMLRLDPS